MTTQLETQACRLEPQVQAFLEGLAAQNPPAWWEMKIDEARRTFAGLTDLFGAGPEMTRVEDRRIGPGVPVRVYVPFARPTRGALLFFHGGGWVLGDLETHDALCRCLAHEAGCSVVSVDYRR